MLANIVASRAVAAAASAAAVYAQGLSGALILFNVHFAALAVTNASAASTKMPLYSSQPKPSSGAYVTSIYSL